MFSDSQVWGGVNFDDVLRGESTSVEWGGGLSLPPNDSSPGSAWVAPAPTISNTTDPAAADRTVGAPTVPLKKAAMCSVHPTRVAEYWNRQSRSIMCGRCLLAGGTNTDDLVVVEDAVVPEANAMLAWLQQVLGTLGQSPATVGAIAASVHRAELSPDDLRLCNAVLPAMQGLNQALHSASLLVGTDSSSTLSIQRNQQQRPSTSIPSAEVPHPTGLPSGVALPTAVTKRNEAAQDAPQPLRAVASPVEPAAQSSDQKPQQHPDEATAPVEQPKKFVVPKPRSRMLLEEGVGTHAAPGVVPAKQPQPSTASGAASPPAGVGDGAHQIAPPVVPPVSVVPPSSTRASTAPAAVVPPVVAAAPPADPVSPLSYLDAIRLRSLGGAQKAATTEPTAKSVPLVPGAATAAPKSLTGPPPPRAEMQQPSGASKARASNRAQPAGEGRPAPPTSSVSKRVAGAPVQPNVAAAVVAAAAATPGKQTKQADAAVGASAASPSISEDVAPRPSSPVAAETSAHNCINDDCAASGGATGDAVGASTTTTAATAGDDGSNPIVPSQEDAPADAAQEEDAAMDRDDAIAVEPQTVEEALASPASSTTAADHDTLVAQPAQPKGRKGKSKQEPVPSTSIAPPTATTATPDGKKKKPLAAPPAKPAPAKAKPKPVPAPAPTPKQKATKKHKSNNDDELLEAVLAQHSVDELEKLRGPFRVFPGVAVPGYPTLLSMIEEELKSAPPVAQQWLRTTAVAVHDTCVGGKDPSAVHRLMAAKQGRYPSALDVVLETYTFNQMREEPYWQDDNAPIDVFGSRFQLSCLCKALSLQSDTSSIHGVPSMAEFVAGIDLTATSAAPPIERKLLIAGLSCHPQLLAMNTLLFDLTTTTRCGSIMRMLRWLLPIPLGRMPTVTLPSGGFNSNPSDHLYYAAAAYHFASFGAISEAEGWLRRIHVPSVLPYDRLMFLRFYCLACMRLGHPDKMRAALPRLTERTWYLTHWFLMRYALLAYMDDTSRSCGDQFANIFAVKHARTAADNDECASLLHQFNELRTPTQLADILPRTELGQLDAGRSVSSAHFTMLSSLHKISDDPGLMKWPIKQSYEMVVGIVAKSGNAGETMWKRQNLEAAEWYLDVNFKMLWSAVMTSGATFEHAHAQLVLLRVNPVTALDHCLASKASVTEVGCSVNPAEQTPADMQQSITLMAQIYERWTNQLFQVPGVLKGQGDFVADTRTVVEYYLQTVSTTKSVTLLAKSWSTLAGKPIIEAAGQVVLSDEALLVLFTDSALITALGNEMYRPTTSAWREAIPVGSMRIASLTAAARKAHPALYERVRIDLSFCLQVCFDVFVAKLQRSVLNLPALHVSPPTDIKTRREVGHRSEFLVIGRGLIDALPFHAFEDAHSGMHLMEMCVLSRAPSTFIMAGQCALRAKRDALEGEGIHTPQRAEVLSTFDTADPTLEAIMQHCPAGSRSRSFAPKPTRPLPAATTPLLTSSVSDDARQMDSERPMPVKAGDKPNPSLMTVLMNACNKNPIYVVDAPVTVSSQSDEHAPWHLWDGRNQAVSHGTGKQMLASGELDEVALIVCTRSGVGLPSGSPMLPEHQIGLHRALIIAGAQRVLVPWRFAAEYVDRRSLPVMQAAIEATFPRSCGVSRAIRRAMMKLKDAGEPLNVWSAFSFYGLD